MNNLIVFGNSEIAELAHFYFSKSTPYSIKAFTLDAQYIKNTKFLGKDIVPFEKITSYYPPDMFNIFIALSYTKLNSIRKDKYIQAKNLGYNFVNYISPRATVLTKNIGNNCFILEDNTIQPFVTIGNNVTLWSGNHIGHHSTIKDHNFVSSHVVISGGCTVEESCFIGVNSTVTDHVTIGKGCLIGAGSLILNDIPVDSLISNKKSEISKIPAHRIRKF